MDTLEQLALGAFIICFTAVGVKITMENPAVAIGVTALSTLILVTIGVILGFRIGRKGRNAKYEETISRMQNRHGNWEERCEEMTDALEAHQRYVYLLPDGDYHSNMTLHKFLRDQLNYLRFGGGVSTTDSLHVYNERLRDAIVKGACKPSEDEANKEDSSCET